MRESYHLRSRSSYSSTPYSQLWSVKHQTKTKQEQNFIYSTQPQRLHEPTNSIKYENTTKKISGLKRNISMIQTKTQVQIQSKFAQVLPLKTQSDKGISGKKLMRRKCRQTAMIPKPGVTCTAKKCCKRHGQK